jgi:molybdenum cofactor cytidylyltransferase
MNMAMLPAAQTVGKILCHNIDDGKGSKAFAKGHTVQPGDVERLVELGHTSVYVAILDDNDVHEDAAATRLARAVMGDGVEATRASTGRVNLLAHRRGVVMVKTGALNVINSIDGLTTATVRQHSVIETGKMVATIKIIPYAVSDESLRQAEAAGRDANGVIAVQPLLSRRVAIILTGSETAREQVIATFEAPLRERVSNLGSQPEPTVFVIENPAALAAAITETLRRRAEMIIIAGQTSIMDKDDLTPQGIRLAGGRVEHYGVPVEPGNLLLLAYAGDVPIMGAPGCARSRHTNVIDLVLPRLLAGEKLQRQDLIALGNGGLL